MIKRCPICNKKISNRAKYCWKHCHTKEWREKNGTIHRKPNTHRFCKSCNKRIDSRSEYCAIHYREYSDWIKNQSKSHMGKTPRLGMKHTDKTKNKIRAKQLGRKYSVEINRKKGSKGNRNPNWKGGITTTIQLLRQCVQYKKWRQDIFIRDNFTCCECGQKGGYLEAHHIKLFSKLVQEARNYMPLFPLYDACMLYTPLWDIDNGITLCKKCHDKTKRKSM